MMPGGWERGRVSAAGTSLPSMWTFRAEPWPWDARSDSWVFVSLPTEVADELAERAEEHGPPRGFGSVRVTVTCGGTTWATSVFPSNQEETFVLPLKKQVRRAEGLEVGEPATFTLDLPPPAGTAST